MTLKLGTAKVDITPRKPVPLAGFKDREGNAQGIAHPLYARILVFQYEHRDGEKTKAILVSADLIWWDTKRARRMREWIARKWGLTVSSVILHATHTHCGPQTSDQFTPSLGRPDGDVIRQIEEKILAGIRRAFQNVEPVGIQRGIGECKMGINRRKMVDGKVIMAPNPEGPVDPEVNVIRFCMDNGQPKAILVHYACHPTTTGDNLISSEFPGVAMELLEEQMGNGAVAVFLQGCCGDIRPALIQDQLFYRGTDKEVCRLGKTLADEVLTIMNRPMQPLRPVPLRSRTLQIDLPFQELPSISEIKKKQGLSGIVGEWSRVLLDQPGRIRPHIPLELTCLEMADHLAFLTMNGEVVVEYGLMMKEYFHGRVLPLPYSNGMIGYIPTAKQTEEGGYEAEESVLYFGLPAPFSPELEKRIHNSIFTLVRKEDGDAVPFPAGPNGDR